MENLMALQRQIDPPRLFLDGQELFGLVSCGLEYPRGIGLGYKDFIPISFTLEVIPYEMSLEERGKLRGKWMTFRTIQYQPGSTGVFLDQIELRGIREANLNLSPNRFLPELTVDMYVHLDREGLE